MWERDCVYKDDVDDTYDDVDDTDDDNNNQEV